MAEYQSHTLTDRLVSKVADRTDSDPVELHPPLNEVIDLEALEALFSPCNSGMPRDVDGHVEFTYEEYRIQVESDGTITIDEASDAE